MSKFYILVFILNFAWTINAYVHCKNPHSHIGHWLGINQECVALVQSQCHRHGNKPIGVTQSWHRGYHIKEHCSKIPHLTAIATFLGPNNHFDEPHLQQHAAIFVKCEHNGIRVYDQWNGTPIGYRLIPWHGNSKRYSGINYYTIA